MRGPPGPDPVCPVSEAPRVPFGPRRGFVAQYPAGAGGRMTPALSVSAGAGGGRTP
jgi:hypothetical protein